MPSFKQAHQVTSAIRERAREIEITSAMTGAYFLSSDVEPAPPTLLPHLINRKIQICISILSCLSLGSECYRVYFWSIYDTVKGNVSIISSDPPCLWGNGTHKTFVCPSKTEICVCKYIEARLYLYSSVR